MIREVESRTKKVAHNEVLRKCEKVEKTFAKTTTRPVEVDQDLVSWVQEQIRQLLSQCNELKTQLATNGNTKK